MVYGDSGGAWFGYPECEGGWIGVSGSGSVGNAWQTCDG